MKEREDELKKKPKNLQEQLLEEEGQPYIDDQGDIIVPAGWRDGDDDLSNEEYEDNVSTKVSLKEQLLVEDYKPYYDEEGILVLPSSWKDEDDPEEDEYWRKFNER